MFRFILLIILAFSVFSCTGKKKAATTNTSQAANSNTITTSSKGEGNIRFVVSFYSVGGGIDNKTQEEFIRFLDTYPKKIVYDPITWGPEGEIDYCLSLSGLSTSEQTNFIKKANEILSKSKLVHIYENSKCEHTDGPWIDKPSAVEDIYRLVVSFYSIGEGTDYKTKEEFEKFLLGYKKKIAFEPALWGREGEVDYCLKINELTPEEQIDFIRKAKELLSKSKLVHVDENAKCVHKH